MELSTRPEKSIGSDDVWKKSEKQLKEVLSAQPGSFKVSEGGGAFYGPKIDVHVKDSLGRSHQCATIQLDFNLPQRFGLKFLNEEGQLEQPVMIHRAIYGSFGRLMAILTEHYQGKWPFWLSPRQIIVVPVSEHFQEYAQKVRTILRKERWYVDVDESDNTLGKKIRNAQLVQYNYILVVGQREMDNGTVSVRQRDNTSKKFVVLSVTDFAELILRPDSR